MKVMRVGTGARPLNAGVIKEQSATIPDKPSMAVG